MGINAQGQTRNDKWTSGTADRGQAEADENPHSESPRSGQCDEPVAITVALGIRPRHDLPPGSLRPERRLSPHVEPPFACQEPGPGGDLRRGKSSRLGSRDDCDHRLRHVGVILPAPTTLERIVASSTSRIRQDVIERIADRLTPEVRSAIDTLVQVAEGDRRSELFQFKQYPPEANAAKGQTGTRTKGTYRFSAKDKGEHTGFPRPTCSASQ
jgi:hypothetical protein